MELRHTPVSFLGLRSLVRWLVEDRAVPAASRHERPGETDCLIERMSLIELADLPLGPEPRFIDTVACGTTRRSPRQDRSEDGHAARRTCDLHSV